MLTRTGHAPAANNNRDAPQARPVWSHDDA
jgi:hypothetical protein